MVPPCIGEVTSQGSTKCTDSGKVAVAEVGTLWEPGERSLRQKMIRGPSEAIEMVEEEGQEAGVSPLVVAGGK